MQFIKTKIVMAVAYLAVVHCSSDQYAYNSYFDGKTCRSSNTVFSVLTPTLMACSALCSRKNSCSGVFYKTESGSCVGCLFADVWTLPTDPGTTHWFKCDNNVDDWTSLGEKKFKLFKDRKNFFKSRASCKRFCADLIHLESPEEQEELHFKMFFEFPVTHHFIGLSDYKREGDWRWLVDDTKPTFKTWAPNEPNTDGDEDCATTDRLKNTWNDVNCYTKSPYVCAKSKR